MNVMVIIIKGHPLALSVMLSVPAGVKNQKVALYKLWLEMDEQASWSKVCDALWQEGKRVLATQLRTKYVNKRQAQANNRGERGVEMREVREVASSGGEGGS